jgi:hypothetical protein
VDIHCDADIFSDDYWEDLPAVVEPYAKQADWWDAYRQAAMRIVARLAKGLLPEPNCTGALCWGHRLPAVCLLLPQCGLLLRHACICVR